MADYQKLNEDEDEAVPEAEVRPKKMLWGYPAQVYFILGNEFCERFSYYGMHAILVIYLTSMLKQTKDEATAVYHAFNMMCYFSPIFGAIIADSYWGKYKTILYVSLVYALGNIVVSVTSVPSILHEVQLAGPYIGLLLIALGTGGIKPCVSAFGGDQFEAGQEEKLASFFSIFYFSINFGSMISMLITPLLRNKLQSFFSIFYFAINFGSLIATLLTPVLRGDVDCFGTDCYPLAFGVPAILMVLSLILFLIGSPLYKKVPPEGNVVVEVSAATFSAIKNKIKSAGTITPSRRDHFIEWADSKYTEVLKSDIKALFRVLFMFLPLPVFWTLFDQQGSRWVLQAMEMNGDIGFTTLKPDQMQALNPVFVMILIPIAETVIYPMFKKCGLLTKPLQKMGTGMGLVALSFVIAGFLQLKMEVKSPVANLPATGFANFRIINAVPCEIDLYSDDMKKKNLTVQYHEATDYFAVPVKMKRLQVVADCPAMSLDIPISVKEKESYSMVIGANHSSMAHALLKDDVTPLKHSHAKVRFVHSGSSVAGVVTVKLGKTQFDNLAPFKPTEYKKLQAKEYSIKVSKNGTKAALGMKKIHLLNGGIYTVVIQPNKKYEGLKLFAYADVSPRPISMLWQVPQYLVITLGEVMFSITGLEFAYSQSPPSMKSCIMAAWLLTVSVGNLVVVILAGVKLTEDMAQEFFFFAILLGVVTVIFAIMAWFYTYVNYGSERRTAADVSEDTEDIPLLSSRSAKPSTEEPGQVGEDDETTYFTQ